MTLQDNSKAILVAGSGPFPGNHLWDSTQISANFAYRTLAYQGFTKESIYYLSSDTDLDLDSNGVLDDVDGDATNANLQDAITNWASDADNLVLYLVGHGGVDTFRMSGTETLLEADLASWLGGTAAQKVVVVYDACESGSVLGDLSPLSGKEPTTPALAVTSFERYGSQRKMDDPARPSGINNPSRLRALRSLGALRDSKTRSA